MAGGTSFGDTGKGKVAVGLEAPAIRMTWGFPFFRITFEGDRESLSVFETPLSELCCELVEDDVPGGADTFHCHVEAVRRYEDRPWEWIPVFPFERERIKRHAEARLFRIQYGGSVAVVNPARGNAGIWLAKEDFAGLPHWRRRRFFTDMILAFLSRGNAFSVHGALLSKNGEGLLILGKRGSGKTTFALSLCLDGWNIHTDDYALVRYAGHQAFASGLRKLLHLAPDTMEMFDVLVEKRLGIFNMTGEKEGVRLRSMGREFPLLYEVPVRKIVFLRRIQGKATAWRPLTTRDAVPLILSQALALELGDLAGKRFQALADLARGASLMMVEGCIDLLTDKSLPGKLVLEME